MSTPATSEPNQQTKDYPVTRLITQTVLRKPESTWLTKVCALLLVFGLCGYGLILAAKNYGRTRLTSHPLVRRAR